MRSDFHNSKSELIGTYLFVNVKGKNLDFYRKDNIRTLRLVDNSEEMRSTCLEKLKTKFDFFFYRRVKYTKAEAENLWVTYR